jgi:hypothetical protein
MQIRELFQSPAKKAQGMAQGSTFAVEFTGEEGTEGEPKEKPRGRSSQWKWARTCSIEAESSLTKKSKNQKCPACNVKGHFLVHCWTVDWLDQTVGPRPDWTGLISKQSSPNFWDWTVVRSPKNLGLDHRTV